MHRSVEGESVPGLHLKGQPLDASLPWAWSVHIHYLEFFCTEDLSFLFRLFTYLIMSMNSWRFTLWVLVQYFVLLLRLFQLLATRNSFSCLLCPMNKAFYLFSFFQALSYFLTLQNTLLILCIFCHRPVINRFPKESFLLSVETGTRNQDLGPYCCFPSSGLSSFFPSRKTSGKPSMNSTPANWRWRVKYPFPASFFLPSPSDITQPGWPGDTVLARRLKYKSPGKGFLSKIKSLTLDRDIFEPFGPFLSGEWTRYLDDHQEYERRCQGTHSRAAERASFCDVLSDLQLNHPRSA